MHLLRQMERRHGKGVAASADALPVSPIGLMELKIRQVICRRLSQTYREGRPSVSASNLAIT
ncbi:hypothetical protein SJ05684_c06850 [Sinorhizobium sojae CCBAU 05684]|uniref:Uncharacterized protein n=1 Tax=Sinorhizobium sojae CCBAU 05684 TaxID=716928 RepID=A0A249PA50_9HYPH|nr:hypothetical protein SJ05684_c06850 [Sinorhizobium sojae CCBAU 05684]